MANQWRPRPVLLLHTCGAATIESSASATIVVNREDEGKVTVVKKR
jgi:hypothetical protein